jgi:hypothetical protein
VCTASCLARLLYEGNIHTKVIYKLVSWDVAVIEHLLSKYESISLIPSMEKRIRTINAMYGRKNVTSLQINFWYHQMESLALFRQNNPEIKLHLH